MRSNMVNQWVWLFFRINFVFYEIWLGSKMVLSSFNPYYCSDFLLWDIWMHRVSPDSNGYLLIWFWTGVRQDFVGFSRFYRCSVGLTGFYWVTMASGDAPCRSNRLTPTSASKRPVSSVNGSPSTKRNMLPMKQSRKTIEIKHSRNKTMRSFEQWRTNKLCHRNGWTTS